MLKYDTNKKYLSNKDLPSITDFVITITKDFDGFNNTKMYHLTYSYHINLNEYLSYFEKIFKDHKNNILFYSMVLENGENKANPHTHIAIKLEKGLYGKKYDIRFFDYNCPYAKIKDNRLMHPHIRKVYHPGHWNTICIYHHKEENSDVITNYTPNWNGVQKFNYTTGMLAFKNGGRSAIYKHIGDNHSIINRKINIYVIIR